LVEKVDRQITFGVETVLVVLGRVAQHPAVGQLEP
jgi:hypothetical protein